MPLFATLLGSLFTSLVGFFAKYLSVQAALRLAAYTSWVALLGALLVSVYVCLSSLLGYVSTMHTSAVNSGQWWSYFIMGVGMFIPSNAGAVMSCIASVWLAMNIYKVQKEGLANYSH